MSLSIAQDAAAADAVLKLRQGVTRAKLGIYASSWALSANTDTALANLEADNGHIDRLEGVELTDVRNGFTSWESWTAHAAEIASDIETQGGITGVGAFVDNLKTTAGNAYEEIKQDVKDAAPYVAVGVSGTLILGIALFLLVEFGRRG